MRRLSIAPAQQFTQTELIPATPKDISIAVTPHPPKKLPVSTTNTTMAATSQTPFPLTGRYAELNKWEILNGPGDARPTAMQVVKDEGLLLIGENGKGKEKGKKNMMSDKAVIVTGVSSGMGPAIVEAMAATGATVFATARNLEKARKALGPDVLGCGRVHLVLMENVSESEIFY